MSYNFSQLKNNLGQTEEWLKKEYLSVRTGRASPAILDGVKVEAYENRMLINQIATISSENSKTLRVVPWDLSQAKNIEKAIKNADLGLSVSVDEKGIRVHFPELSEERREFLIKSAKAKLEEARVRVRNEREKVWEDIQEKTKDGEITEDQKFKLKEEMQKTINEFTKKFEELSERKEKEILS